jgi:hypothetical protein
MQPSNAGGFRRLAFTKPAKDNGKRKETTSKSRTAVTGGTLCGIFHNGKHEI